MFSDRRPRSLVALALLAALPLAACGKKGDPMPPPRAVPAAVKDLALVQRGDQVLLDFGHPQATVAGLTLPALESVTLYELDKPAPAAGQALAVAPQELAGAKSVVELTGADLAAAITGDRIRLAWKLPQPLPEPAVARAFAVKTKALHGAASDFSNVASLVPKPAPTAPAELEVEARKDGVEVTWSAAADATAGYAILRRDAQSAQWGPALAHADKDATSWLDRSARYGQRYVYTVLSLAARDPDVESAQRSESEVDYVDRFAPAAPAAPRALALPGEVHLIWEASPDADVVGYRLERASAQGDFAPVGPATISGLEFVDSGLAPESLWRYRVLAVDNAGNASPPSPPVEVQVP
jgi:predicted small lipoprotein YifL